MTTHPCLANRIDNREMANDYGVFTGSNPTGPDDPALHNPTYRPPR
jgi:hypothetical protein